jgi:ABC-type nitrate/sulfonate/bicarbonate transport system substrate-binding protein
LAYRPFVERSPRVVAAVLDFLARVSDWGNTHLDEAAHIISSDTGIPEDVTRIALSRAPLAIEPLNAAIIARQQAAADVFHAQGFIPAPVVIKDMIWTRDLAKATAAL